MGTDEGSLLRFAYAFIKHYQDEGIFDEYDSEADEVVTSEEIKALYDMACEAVPEEIDAFEAQGRNEALTDEELDIAIELSPEVVDCRKIFVERMSANGGAYGLIKKLINSDGHYDKDCEILSDMRQLVEETEGVNDEETVD